MRGSGVIASAPDPNPSKTLTSLSITPKGEVLLHTYMQQLLNTKVCGKKIKNEQPNDVNRLRCRPGLIIFQ